ncbi:MAG: hypothetical protein K8F27_06880 [Sulfuricellaceae bacterium]|nr:hypothetical protein [Sulfuricellaceae bacterium]
MISYRKLARAALFIVAAAFFNAAAWAADPAWLWAKQADVSTASSTATASTVTADPAGNIYVAGTFQGTAKFGAYSLTSAGGYADVFVAKYDSGGNSLWALAVGGSCQVGGIAADATRVYLTGSCVHGASFGGHPLPASPSYNGSVYVATIDPAGSFTRVLASGGSGDMNGTAIAIDSEGSILVTGSYTNTPTLLGTTLTGSGGAFVFKVNNATDTLAWIKSSDGSANAVTADSAGNVYIAGSFARGTAVFGGTTLTVGLPYGNTIPFVAKLDKSGNWLWAKGMPSRSYDMSNGVAADAAGNIYVTGRFVAQITFDATTLTATAMNAYTAFIAKLDPSGNFLWTRQAGAATQYVYGKAVTINTDGNPVMSGAYCGTATFGSLSLTPKYKCDAFVTELGASSGDYLWAKSAGGNSGNESADALALAPGGNLIVAGNFEDNISFNTTLLSVNRPTDYWVNDMFLATLGQGTALPAAPAMSVGVSGQTVTISWSPVANADSYTLYYAPYPAATSVGSADMGTAKNLSLTLPSGSAFYVAVKANNSGGASDFSNIGYFIVP